MPKPQASNGEKNSQVVIIEDSPLFQADKFAGDLFDAVVDQALSGEERLPVVAKFVETGEMDDDSEPKYAPLVMIGTLSGQEYARLALTLEIVDDEILDAAVAQFEVMMAGMWDNTIAHYDELEALGPMMDELAVSSNAGFLDKALAQHRRQGHRGVSDTELVLTARILACEALGEWAAAVDEQAELEDLGLQLNALAMSSEAGFYDQVDAELKATGFTNIGDGEMLSMARSLARTALGEWAKAVEVLEKTLELLKADRGFDDTKFSPPGAVSLSRD